MRVLFLQRQPCIRTLKYAIGLRSARPDIRLGFACQPLELDAAPSRAPAPSSRYRTRCSARSGPATGFLSTTASLPTSPPSATFPRCCRQPRPANAPGPWRVVYQGTLSTNSGHYDLRSIFTAMVAPGVELDIYPTRPSPPYQELADDLPGLRVHEPIEPSKLLQELAAYDFGWAGFNATLNGAHLATVQQALEYLGCGLPS